MADSALHAEDLMAWNDASAQRWRELVTAHPEILLLACDIYKPGTVGELLQHVVAAELRYAERLIEAPVTDYGAISFATADQIYETHERAFAIYQRLLASSSFDWEFQIEFPTLTAGRRRASRKAVFHHALLHGIRHYAQLATLVRSHGFKVGPADYLFTNSIALV